MNMIPQLVKTPLRRLLLILSISGSLAACGSAIVSAGISGTGIVVGVLTGFGSIFVNGVEYEIDTAQFDIDGQRDFANAAEAQQLLAVGMVVRLEAKDNGDGTGTAVRVVYDDSVEGPIQTVPAPFNGDPKRLQFTVLDKSIVVDQFETTFEDSAFDQLAMNQVVEVSGFIDANGSILATRIQGKGDLVPGQTQVELRGAVASLSGNQFLLDARTIVFDDNTRFEDMQAADLVDGMHVEVKGTYQNDGSILASRIEGEQDDREEIPSSNSEIELQGVIYSFVSAGEFYVNGVQVDASGLSPVVQLALQDGVELEIKGHMENAVLIAEKVEFRGAEAEMQARIVAADSSASTVAIDFGNGVTRSFGITAESLLKDDRNSAPSEALTLSRLVTELNGGNNTIYTSLSIRQQGGDWVVVKLKLKDSLYTYEVDAAIEELDVNTGSVTMFGMPLSLDVSAIPGLANLNLAIGDHIELKDTDKNGVFDQIEVND